MIGFYNSDATASHVSMYIMQVESCCSIGRNSSDTDTRYKRKENQGTRYSVTTEVYVHKLYGVYDNYQ